MEQVQEQAQTVKQKSDWKQVVANSNLIQHATDRAVLIKLPKSDFKFWHPSKCVRTSGKNNYRMTISYTDSFIFKCFKTGNGRYNFKDKIAEMELNAAEFEKYFNEINGKIYEVRNATTEDEINIVAICRICGGHVRRYVHCEGIVCVSCLKSF